MSSNKLESRKMEFVLDAQTFYEEANTSRRYYLSLAVRTRNIAIVQGVAVLVAYGVLLSSGSPVFLLIPAGFGFLFTLVLAALHWNYLMYFEDSQKYLLKIEKRYGITDMNFCSDIEMSRNKRVGKGFKRYFILYGAFFLLGIITSILLLLSFYLVLTQSLPQGLSALVSSS